MTATRARWVVSKRQRKLPIGSVDGAEGRVETSATQAASAGDQPNSDVLPGGRLEGIAVSFSIFLDFVHGFHIERECAFVSRAIRAKHEVRHDYRYSCGFKRRRFALEDDRVAFGANTLIICADDDLIAASRQRCQFFAMTAARARWVVSKRQRKLPVGPVDGAEGRVETSADPGALGCLKLPRFRR